MNKQNNRVLKTAIAIIGIALPATINFASAQTLSKTAKVGKGIYEIVFSEKDNALYIASAGSRTAPAGYIYKVNAKDLSVIDSIDVKVAPAYGLGINQKTQRLYTTNTRSNSVHAIDLKTGKILATITNGKEKPHVREVIVDEDKNLVYVSDVQKEGIIWVIDGKTNKLSHLIENVGESTTGIALDKKRNQLYAVNMASKDISVVDLKSNKVVRKFPSGGEGSINLVYDAKGDRLFVAHQKSNNVTVIKPATGEIIKTIPAGNGALGINFDTKNNLVYVASRGDGNVTVINGDNYEVVQTIA
ncbi:YncE family protein, partial [Pseudoxanthomonas sp. SGD-10]